MTTRSVDPAGQHQLPPATGNGSRITNHWNDQFPVFDVPFNLHLQPDSFNPKPLQSDATWLIAAGSDLMLQCERVPGASRSDWVVHAYDSSGNPLGILGQFQSPATALAALPTLMTVAHMLFPNFLLMNRDAKHPWEQEGQRRTAPADDGMWHAGWADSTGGGA